MKKRPLLNFITRIAFLLALSTMLTSIKSYSQGVFGGKVAVLGQNGQSTYFNTNSQTCDGAGTGNLSSSNPTAYTAYLGDKFYMGGNVLTFNFNTNYGAFLQWRFYVVGGSAPSYGTALNFSGGTFTSGVCSGSNNIKIEQVPISGSNAIQCTSVGNYRLDANLVGYNNGTNYIAFLSGNYIPFTVNALGDPTSCTASISGTTANLSWSRFTGSNSATYGGSNVTYNTMIVRYAAGATPTLPTNGSSYSLNASIGSGTVVYASGAGGSTTDNSISSCTNYDYYFYSENYTYYSSGIKVSATQLPTITSVTSSVPSNSTTQTYKGATITIAGCALNGGTPVVKLGGSGGTTISSPTISATQIQFTFPDATSSGTFYVSNGTNNFTSSNSLTNLGYITTSAGLWSNFSTWLGGITSADVPNSTTAAVTIANNVTLDNNETVKNITINASTVLTSSATNYSTLTIASGGTFTNNNATNGYLATSHGKVAFSGGGTISGTTTFGSVDVSGGAVSFGSASTINDSLTISGGGYVVDGSAPIYGVGSTLRLNSGGTFLLYNNGDGAGWYQNVSGLSPKQGVPYNVIIGDVTTTAVSYNNSVLPRYMNGSLTISSGSSLILGSSGVTNGDLSLAGNLINNSGSISGLNTNGRAFFFTGSNTTQTISGSQVTTINYMVFNGTNDTVKLNGVNIITDAPNGGNGMSFGSSTNVLDLNGNNITLGTVGKSCDIVGGGKFKGNSASSLAIQGTGSTTSSLAFVPSYQQLNNLTINKTSSGNINLGSDLTLSGTLTLTAGTFTVGSNTLSLNGSAIGGTTTNLTTSSSSSLSFGGSSSSITIPSSVTILNNLTINNSNGVSVGAGITVTGALTLTSGILNTTSSNLLTIGSSGSISSASSSSYINGPLARILTSTTATSFPIGKGGNYRPVTFTYTTNPTSKTVTIEQFESTFPGTIANTATVSRFGTRYWNITQSSTGINYTIGLNNGGLTPTGTVVIYRRDATSGNTAASNGTSFTTSTYTTSSSFAATSTGNDVTLAETAIPLTITGAITSNKVYDRTNTASITGGSLVGVVSPDIVTLTQSGTFAQIGIGTSIAITSTSTLSGANAGAYTLTQPSLIPRNITALPLTVTGAITTNKVYDGTNTASLTGGTLVGVISPDAVTLTQSGTFAQTTVGTGIAITSTSALSGADAGNYTLTQPSLTARDITAAPLTITGLTGANKTYDGLTTATFTGTAAYSGLQNGESFAVTGTPSASFTSAAVGNGKTINVTGYTAPSANYSITQPSLTGNILGYTSAIATDFRSQATGNLNTPTTWQFDQGGSSWVTSDIVPVGKNITIQNSHTITQDVDYTVASGKTFTISSGGSLVINPTSTLTIAGTADFGNQSVTLQSTSITNGGAIGTITGTLTGATNITVQRYTQAQRGYRTIANPFTAAQSLSQLTNTIRITGLTAANGTYGVNSGNPSAFYYDPTKPAGNSSVLQPITSATDASHWPVGSALYVFIRGNGLEGSGGAGVGNYTSGTISPVTLSMSGGTINQGSVPVSLGYGSGTSDNYNLIGNPYPCPVNLKAVTGMNSFGTVYVYNPVKSIGSGNKYSISGGFDSYTNNGSNDIIIPSLGGFYIKATGSGQSITFNESNKITSTTPNVTIFGSGTPDARIRLSVTTANGNVDDLKFGFNANSTALANDFYDAPKLSNSLLDFYSLSSDKARLAIDYRDANAINNSIIPLGIQTGSANTYSISLSELTDLPNTQVVLRDKLLKTETILSQIGDSYSFDITADTATKGDNRFEIGLLGTTVLPVTIADITAQLQTNKTVAVNWTSATELNLAYYNVQRSVDGSNFSTVGKVAATGAGNYRYSDDLATISNLPTTVYYRLQSVDKNASSAYSKVVSCQLLNAGKQTLSIYPNPVQATLFAQITVTKAGSVEITVRDLQGKLLSKQITQVAAGTTAVSVNTASLAVGSYVLVVNGTDGSQQQQFVKE
jgi:hypothetical protein